MLLMDNGMSAVRLDAARPQSQPRPLQQLPAQPPTVQSPCSRRHSHRYCRCGHQNSALIHVKWDLIGMDRLSDTSSMLPMDDDMIAKRVATLHKERIFQYDNAFRAK